MSSSASRSWKYDVFLSFRGEDTRNTFVDHLYYALEQRAIRTYKDDVTLDRGDTIGPSLLKAIEESHILVIIFSENYADSLWCLDELSHIMKCRNNEKGQIVFPVFYHVDPSDVRKQKRKYEEAFAKYKLSENNKKKAKVWKKALVDASNIAGWESKHVANGHEAKCIQEIVNSILDRLSSLNSVVDDENLVGMAIRLKDLKQLLRIGSSCVRMVGIWGIGGGGKTTLATSLYMDLKTSSHFIGCCFVGNIREESRQQNGLQRMQERILLAVFDKVIQVESVELGKYLIKGMLSHRNVLIVLDDVDHLDQLKALAGCREWFGDGSRIVITTRDKHLLTTHKVDDVSHVSLLSHDEAIELFNKHAYHEDKPLQDYEMLSLQIVSYAAGLPLALIVLGSFLYDKDKDEWLSTLARLTDHPEMDIIEKLKISYDGLKPVEKELFLDIACFYRGTKEDNAMEILDACGFYPRIGVKVLIQKALITISADGKFDMHDMVQEMGHYIVRGEHPNNPEKHSRVWRNLDIKDMCSRNATMIEAIKCDVHGCSSNCIMFVSNMKLRSLQVWGQGNYTTMENDKIEAFKCDVSDCSSSFIMLVSNMKKLRFLKVTTSFDEGPGFLSNELRYIEWESYPASPFPESFNPTKLVVLKIDGSLQKELWKGYKYLPCLKDLQLVDASELVRTPDFGGLPCLQKLILRKCGSLEEIHESLGNHNSLVHVHVEYCAKLPRFPTIVGMKKLEILKISECKSLIEFPKIEAKMDNLYLPCLKDLQLVDATGLVRTPDFGGLPCLEKLILSKCGSLQHIHQSLGNHASLVYVSVSCCNKLTRFPTVVQMDKLEILRVSECKALVEFPKIEAKMDNLTKLKLISVGIEVLPSSVGEYCTNLISLKLEGCSELKSIEGNFYALKHLKKFELILCRQLEKVPEDLFHENCHLEKLSLYLCDLVSSSNKQLTVSRLPRFLRKLDLSLCELKDGEIPSEIGELMNLQELHLRYNSFTRLDFSLSQLTRLKLLGLNGCDNLVELPELPSSLAILRADCCSSLNAIIRDDIHINCKSLCKVSIVKGGKSIIGGERLLETMLLQGKAVDSRCMSLRLEGPEIANGFEPRLVRGRRCRMQLPENWYNHFCGFLICAVLNAYAIPMITMTHVEKGGSMETDHYYWRESAVDKNKGTWVGYVSFGVLRNTSWWDQTSPAIQIEIQTDDSSVCGCGFKLIPKASENGQREKTPTNSSSEYSDDEYTCPFEIQHDSKHDLQCFFN